LLDRRRARGRSVAWIAWLGVTFGLFALAATGHEAATRLFADFARPSWTWTAKSAVRAARVYLTNERDEQRYLAYLDAALGRPYQPYFVRPLVAWSDERVAIDVFIDTEAAPVSAPRRLVPYRDFLVEYPPGFFLWTLPPALLTTSLDGYCLAFALWMALCATAALLVCLQLARRPAFARARRNLVALTTAATFAIGAIVTHRYDASVALLLCLAAWAAIQRRPVVLGIAIGLAAVTKVVPILVVPPLALWLLHQRRWRELRIASVAALVSSAAVAAPFAWVAGRALFESAGYHLVRPLQIESTAAALVALLDRPSVVVVQSYGSVNLIGPTAAWASRLSGMATPIAIAIAYGLGARRMLRLDRDDSALEHALLPAMLAPLIALMLTAKVFSPQYLVWILPLATLLSSTRGGVAIWLWLGICVATQIVYPAAYSALIHLHKWICVLVLLRNVALGVWLSTVWSPRRSRTRMSVRDPDVFVEA
jgi:hypothetical protein